MRVVGGRLRGRPLATPAHEGLRPTSDRVRESVFNILLHGIDGFTLEGARVMDLFAGTGALGIEALSRGASYCLLVDDNASARALQRQNVEAFGLTGATKIWRRDATDLGSPANIQKFTLAFLDPPYAKGLSDSLCERALQSLTNEGWLAPGAIIVLEERAGAALTLPPHLTEIDRRSWGDTEARFLRSD